MNACYSPAALLLILVLFPQEAMAHDFSSLKTAFIPFAIFHVLGMVPWVRRWSLLAKVGYLLLLPLALVAGIWLVNAVVVPAPFVVAVIIWCLPALTSLVIWVSRHSSHSG